MKVRTKYSRVAESRGYKPGEVMEVSDDQGQRLIDAGEADPYVEGEPNWVPPEGWPGARPVVANSPAPTAAPAPTPPAPRGRQPVGAR